LWMGDVELYMSKDFIMHAFHQMGENVLDVKMMKNKVTGGPASFCFVEFENTDKAQKASLRLSGQIIPGSHPPRRFKLNLATSSGKVVPEYSIFVGELDPKINDYALYKEFLDRYPSTKTAKVVLDENGQSRTYGFVRFTDENDQTRALMEMSGQIIGEKRIHVHAALPKRNKDSMPIGLKYSKSPYHNSHMNAQHSQASTPYGYGAQWKHTDWGSDAAQYAQQNQYWNAYQGSAEAQNEDTTESDFQLQDPCISVEVDEMNERFIERSEEFYTALEESRWHPLDNVLSKVAAITTYSGSSVSA